MSRKQLNKNVEEENDEEDIDPSTLIDTQENKPKIPVQEEDLIEPDNSNKVYKKLEYKNVSKLTKDEQDYLIDLYKNGGEDDIYKVYFYKKRTQKIVKKK